MKLRLRPPSHLPPGLQSCYDASDLNVSLGGMFLSHAGVVGNEGEVKLKICIPCQTSLLDKKRVNPPKFAIANGLWMGRLPAIFEDSTLTENAMLNLSQPMHYISVVRGGKHSSLRSHAYFFRAEPAPPAQIPPRDVVTQDLIGVTIVGAMTPEQQATTLKQYDVGVTRLRDQLDWYKLNNHLYTNVEEHADWESTIPTRVVVSRSDVVDTEQLASMNGVAASDSATGSYGSPDSEISHEASTHDGAISGVQSSEVATEAIAGDRPSSNSLFPRSKNHQKTFQSEIGSDSAATNFDLPNNTILRSMFQDGLNDLDRSTWRHNAPAPAHQNVEGIDEIHEQASVG
ncbi:unnamed protein product [Phytophthora fragariaefolia]|uniref:Unnamed protein product n=1 Tax=Phytophthora fragariaefolia TaxID=1490495 RepID=A0A9W6X5N7_9STRA|nr:unnamed protein product [Phytophthora fragariaefolia]